jgi:hypothetical protein
MLERYRVYSHDIKIVGEFDTKAEAIGVALRELKGKITMPLHSNVGNKPHLDPDCAVQEIQIHDIYPKGFIMKVSA